MNSPAKRITIVGAEFNREFVDGLIEAAAGFLQDAAVTVHRVPGAYEIPLAVKRVLEGRHADAVIAFAVIWQGKTDHADIIARDVSRALMELMLAHNCPVIQQILTVQNEQQARERCFGKELNRGREGAEAALKMLEVST